jgi:hypothetical protein
MANLQQNGNIVMSTIYGLYSYEKEILNYICYGMVYLKDNGGSC